MPSELVYANVRLLSTDECKETYDDFDRTQLCAKNKSTISDDAPDGCEGDSGGPLICNGKFEYISIFLYNTSANV